MIAVREDINILYVRPRCRCKGSAGAPPSYEASHCITAYRLLQISLQMLPQLKSWTRTCRPVISAFNEIHFKGLYNWSNVLDKLEYQVQSRILTKDFCPSLLCLINYMKICVVSAIESKFLVWPINIEIVY